MRVVAVIPARGGSKGIARKNLRRVAGLPLVERSVNAAQAATRVDCVIVSSDDDEILSLARSSGARGIKRPDAIATDEASSEDALLHVLECLEAEGSLPEIIVFLQCTSPFTRGRDIDALVEALDSPAFDCSFTAASNHAFIWRRDENGQAVGVNHDARLPRRRRQDLAPEYRENGAGYAMRVDPFRRARNRFCGPAAIVETDLPSIEIDDQQDLDIVDAIARARHLPTLDPDVLRKLKYLVTDFDGVHTDDLVYVSDEGREQVRCSRSDGMGISLLRKAGVEVLILSKEDNAVVTRRAEKLKAGVIQGVSDKVQILERWLLERDAGFDAVAYVGNDINDLGCMTRAAISFAPADAHPMLDGIAHKLSHKGGEGAVREVCDLILKHRVDEDAQRNGH